MMKNYKTKGSKDYKRLRCERECTVPGYGNFKPGDVVTDPEVVEYLTRDGSHPFFTSADSKEE